MLEGYSPDAMARCNLLLTGGIGSGKSTVARLLGERGAEVIESDLIGHAVLAGPAKQEVLATWPEVGACGEVDRRKLADIVFREAGQLRRLEAITHPLIRAEISRRVRESHGPLVVVELPLMVDWDLPGRWVRVLVDSDPEVRLERLAAAGVPESEAQRRMRMQPPRHTWLESADFLIENDGTLEDLEAEVERMMARLERCRGRA
jgi:dephospho-CoA kinase